MLSWYYTEKRDPLTRFTTEVTYRVYGFQEDEDGVPMLWITEYKGSTTSEEFARYICDTMNKYQRRDYLYVPKNHADR